MNARYFRGRKDQLRVGSLARNICVGLNNNGAAEHANQGDIRIEKEIPKLFRAKEGERMCIKFWDSTPLFFCLLSWRNDGVAGMQ
jgi:hypothetical protein